LPDFSWYNLPTREKIYQMTTKCIPNGHKMYQHLSLQDPPKFTQIGIFGLKMYNLATLSISRSTLWKGLSLILSTLLAENSKPLNLYKVATRLVLRLIHLKASSSIYKAGASNKQT
jgi:hypothetical protein